MDGLDGPRGARGPGGGALRGGRLRRRRRLRARRRPRSRRDAGAVGRAPTHARPDDNGVEGTRLVRRPARPRALRLERQRRPDRVGGTTSSAAGRSGETARSTSGCSKTSVQTPSAVEVEVARWRTGSETRASRRASCCPSSARSRPRRVSEDACSRAPCLSSNPPRPVSRTSSLRRPARPVLATVHRPRSPIPSSLPPVARVEPRGCVRGDELVDVAPRKLHDELPLDEHGEDLTAHLSPRRRSRSSTVGEKPGISPKRFRCTVPDYDDERTDLRCLKRILGRATWASRSAGRPQRGRRRRSSASTSCGRGSRRPPRRRGDPPSNPGSEAG